MKTKIKLLTLFVICLLTTNLLAQNPNFEWVKQMGGTGSDSGISITTDVSGNVYTMGIFEGTVDFNPGAGTMNLTSNGNADIFIQKLDASGNFLWARHMGGPDSDNGVSFITDVSGNVYTTGFFQGTADFDPGAGTTYLTSNGVIDIFIQKLDASGNFLWVKQMGGPIYDRGGSITTDASGNVYTTGVFDGTVDLDPGAGTTYLTSNGFQDIFIQKLDASGNFLWVKQMGGTSFDNGASITTDISGNVYTTGSFQETADFDPGTGTTDLTSNGDVDIFIQKLDASGNFLWVKQMGGSDNDYSRMITTDVGGNVYTTGYFNETVDFDPGVGITNLTSNGYEDIFVQKLDASGNFLWANHMGGTSTDYASSIATDASGNLYITGLFTETVDFDPGAGITNLTSNGYEDIFIQKLDASGNFLWVKQTGGPNIEAGESITTDASGNVYTTGVFDGTVDFDPGTGTTYLTSNGDFDVFIQKLGGTVGIIENSFKEHIQVYPNPTNGFFAIEFENTQKGLSIRLSSVSGQLIETRTFHNTDLVQMKLNQPNGVYLVEVLNDDGSKAVIRLIKK